MKVVAPRFEIDRTPRWEALVPARVGIGERLGVILALVLGLTVAAEARGQTPRVTIEADTTEIHVGDPLGLRLSIEHPSDMAVEWPDRLELGPFETLALEVEQPVSAEGGLRSSARLLVTAFELGELELPSIRVSLTDGSGETVTVASDPLVIGVTTVGLDEGGDIRDVKGPRAIARNWLLLWPWALLALLVLGGVVWLVRHRRASVGPGGAEPPVPERPAHEVALEALARLQRSSLLERGEIKRYHIEVSQILRTYIEGRYRIWALEMITPEVILGLQEVGVEAATCAEFRRFLDACDLVKFAKHRPDAAASAAILETGRELVETTKFVPEPAAGEGGDAERVAEDSTAEDASPVEPEPAEAVAP